MPLKSSLLRLSTTYIWILLTSFKGKIVDADRTAPTSVVWSWSTLFVEEVLKTLQEMKNRLHQNQMQESGCYKVRIKQ